MAIATRTLENFIGGRWVPSEADRTIDDVNPADPDDVLARVPLSSLEEAEAAIAAAADAFPAWKAMSPVRRGQMLVRASKILEERQEEVARLITREQGKTLAEARAEVPRAIQFWGWMGYQGGSIQGITAPTESDELMALTLREPLGVVSLITPWNFPINIPGWKVASALVCGNTVVLKPAQLTPLCGVALVEILAEAGLPDGVVNLVLGSGSQIGDVLVQDERVRAISFTGSTATGLSINAKAAPLGKKVQAEMGGHNAVVVLEDADLDRAAAGAAAAGYGTTGQGCTAPRRIIAVRDVAADLTERLRAATRAVRIGPGDREGSDVGPMVDEASLNEVLGEIERAREEGAPLLEGSRRSAPRSSAPPPSSSRRRRPFTSTTREQKGDPMTNAPTGVIPAIPTPFTPDGNEVDVDALRRVVRHVLDGGVHGVMTTGGTGEFPHLSREERRLVNEVIASEAAGAVPIFAGTSACATWEAIAFVDDAAAAGA